MGDSFGGEIDENVLERYEIKRRIGKGAYGIVWKAVDKCSDQVVAVKKIFDAFKNKTDAQRTYREVMFLRSFGHHPNIIKLLSVLKAENDLDLYLVFEHMDSDLHDVIKRGNILKDIHKRYIMHQLLSALKCLHSLKVIHRDLKPSNILLDADCRIRVADFGLARSLLQLQEDEHGDPPLTEYVATRWYRAPEILLADKMYTAGVDMWSVGCILGEMIVGKPLFPGTSTLNQIERIMSAIASPTPQDVRSMCTGYALTVLERVINRPKRPLRDIVPNATADDSVDLLAKLLVFNPNKRLSAEKALLHPYFNRFKSSTEYQPRTSSVDSSLNENRKLSIQEYRERIYQVIKENYCQEPNNREALKNEEMEEVGFKNDESTEIESEISVNSFESKCSVLRNEPRSGVIGTHAVRASDGSDESPPSTRVGKWTDSDVTLWNGRTNDQNGRSPMLRNAHSQDYLPSPSKSQVDIEHSPEVISASPPCDPDRVCFGRQPAGLPSCHPRANTASAWLRYHWPVIMRESSIPKTPNKMIPLSKERIKSSFGKKQFRSCANMSSLGSPKVEMHSFSQNQGTIAASALRQLRLTNKI